MQVLPWGLKVGHETKLSLTVLPSQSSSFVKTGKSSSSSVVAGLTGTVERNLPLYLNSICSKYELRRNRVLKMGREIIILMQ